MSVCRNVLVRVCELADAGSHAWQTPALVCVLCLCLCVRPHAYMVIYVQTHVFQRLHMFAPFTQRFYIQFLPFCKSQTYNKLQILLPQFFFFFFTAFPHEETVKDGDLHTCA